MKIIKSIRDLLGLPDLDEIKRINAKIESGLNKRADEINSSIGNFYAQLNELKQKSRNSKLENEMFNTTRIISYGLLTYKSLSILIGDHYEIPITREEINQLAEDFKEAAKYIRNDHYSNCLSERAIELESLQNCFLKQN